jgi:ABC-type uncharacterized transport system permease subunit
LRPTDCTGVGTAISVIIWLTVLIYWTGGFFYRLEGLQVWSCPRLQDFALLPLILPAVHPSHTPCGIQGPPGHIPAGIQPLYDCLCMPHDGDHGANCIAATSPHFMQNLPPLLTMERL